MTDPKSPTLAETLFAATLAQEAAFLTAMEAGLHLLTQPDTAPRTEVQQEQDYDNFPV